MGSRRGNEDVSPGGTLYGRREKPTNTLYVTCSLPVFFYNLLLCIYVGIPAVLSVTVSAHLQTHPDTTTCNRWIKSTEVSGGTEHINSDTSDATTLETKLCSWGIVALGIGLRPNPDVIAKKCRSSRRIFSCRTQMQRRIAKLLKIGGKKLVDPCLIGAAIVDRNIPSLRPYFAVHAFVD